MTFNKHISLITLCSMILQYAAFAVDPVGYSQTFLDANTISTINKMVQERAEHFATLDTNRQISILDRADRRYSRLITRVEGWSVKKTEHKQVQAINMLNTLASMASSDEAEESDEKAFALNSDEQELYGTSDANSLAPQVNAPKEIKPVAKAQLLANMHQYQQYIRDAKAEIIAEAKNNKGVFRRIASLSPVAKGLLTAMFAVLILAGVIFIVVGIVLTVATLGLLSPIGILWVTLGVFLIAGSITGIPLVWCLG